MMRQLSHGSGFSSTSSPKAKKSFFPNIRRKPSSNSTAPSGQLHLSQDVPTNVDRVYLHPHSDDPIVASPNLLSELEGSRSPSFPSPDPFVGATHDPEYVHLEENLRRLRKAPSGADAKKLDAMWEVYKKVRDENLHLCKSLLQKSQNNYRNTSLDSNIDPLDTRSSFSGSASESTLPLPINDQWQAAIQEYKAIQEQMLENFRTCLVATYMKHEPGVSNAQMDAFLDDIAIRKGLTSKWRDASVHAMRSEKPLHWEQLKIRSLNFERLKLDADAITKLFAEPDEPANSDIREYVIAKNGDAILEFGNKCSKPYPVLRFRVSSHLLAESSQLFAQMLLPQQPGSLPVPDMEGQLPPPPSKLVCKDGMEVKVYRMPQIELNKHDSLTILLHAAHMHNNKIPRQIDFQGFVSVAEVCLRYRCTSPLELPVEYQWLPQWVHLINNDSPDGLLLISYTFGIRRIFTRMTKTAILNSLDNEDIQAKELWPQPVKDKIKAVRAAKIAQVRECCTNALGEYFRPPSNYADRRASVGSLELTTVPRCPKGSHHCDATNLGWLMLVYNELRLLPGLTNDIGIPNISSSPRRSLKDLVNCLRLMPSAPQVHSGVCDYAPAFRSAIDDISNSISGLTLRDVTGREGWALSKNAGPLDDGNDENAVELPASPESRSHSQSPSIVYEESITHYSPQASDPWSDGVERRSERAGSQASREAAFNDGGGANVRAAHRRISALATPSEDMKFLATDKSELNATIVVSSAAATGNAATDNANYVSPPSSPLNDLHMSTEEAHKILWPDSDAGTNGPRSGSFQRVSNERNEKFLLDDVTRAGAKDSLHGNGGIRVAHIEEKARIMEDGKHLRDEKDRALGLGILKQSSPL